MVAISGRSASRGRVASVGIGHTAMLSSNSGSWPAPDLVQAARDGRIPNVINAIVVEMARLT